MSYDINKVLEDYLTSEAPDPTATDLASALKYARSLFKNPETSKIVVVSDGIETDNAATSVIKAIAADGVKVDTVYFPNEEHDELQIYSVKTPDTRIILGDNFITELTVRSNLKGEKAAIITAYDNDEIIGTADVVLENTEQTFEIALAFEERGMHELRFEIKCEDDTVEQNNSYRVYLNLEAFDNILLIEHKEGDGKKLAELLNETFVVTDISLSGDYVSFILIVRVVLISCNTKVGILFVLPSTLVERNDEVDFRICHSCKDCFIVLTNYYRTDIFRMLLP
jgi:hypothetical protein